MVKKIKIYNSFKISKIHKNSILLIGNFEGLHLGHQKFSNMKHQFPKTIRYCLDTLELSCILFWFLNS